jgi:isochorismate synthase
VVCSSEFSLKLNSKSCIQYFKKLIQLNHDAFCYLFYQSEIGVWIGASPEKLLNLDNGIVTTFALAGTKKDMNHSWTDKEFREQKIVEEQIVTDLKRKCINIEIGVLQTVKAGNLYHLKSVIKAKTKKSSSELIKLLHPTPAIAGTPKNKAISYINKMENYNRSFYTGYLGLFEKNSCDIYVNIRCAKIFEENLAIYVGGGITKDSKAPDEWNEIVNKSQTMLAVFNSR